MDVGVLISVVRNLTVAKQYAAASCALYLFEYIITLDKEVRQFWTRKFSFATALWFLNRYTFIATMTPTLLGFHGVYTDEQCLHFLRYPAAMQIISNAAAGVTLSLRVYALYGKAIWTLVILILVLLAEIGMSLWSIVAVYPAPLPPGIDGCIIAGTTSSDNSIAVYWLGQLIFPALVFFMTVMRVLIFRKHCGGSFKDGILSVMLRDGFTYFLVIFLANLVNFITFSLASEELRFANATFSYSITTVMICRLMLNLRHAGSRMLITADTSLQFKTPSTTLRTGFSGFEAETNTEVGTDHHQTRGSGSSGYEYELTPKKHTFDFDTPARQGRI